MTQSSPLSRVFHTKSGKEVSIALGTGTKWKQNQDINDISSELVDNILLALKLGFRHIDTAEAYNTQKEVGEALKKTDIPREDLWITTKYSPGWGSIKAYSKSPKDSIDKALSQLGVDYIDLFLIHSPFFTEEHTHGYNLEQVWEALVEAKKEGKVREIGVSNAAIPHLERLFAASPSPEFYPVANQIEFHPFLQNQSKNIVEFSQKHGILVEAFSPLAPLSRVEDNALADTLKKLAEKYNKTEAQILLRYTLQRGILPVTTSSKENRLKESLEVFDFELTKEEVDGINQIDSTVKLYMMAGTPHLSKLLASKHLEVSEIFCFWKQLCSGILYLHSRGICHRDLKLENIVFDEEYKFLKIIDFAAADAANGGPSVGLVGSEKYAAPETYASIKYDGKASDIWSMGIILYYLMHSKFPWKQAHRNDPHYRAYSSSVNLLQFINEGSEITSQILEPDVEKRVTISRLWEDSWFTSLPFCSESSSCGLTHTIRQVTS
ncbi:hypothetical protein KGF57_000857 [Candida theae]|uniref:2-dehydropantolactone reductase n=1 Tax=Candida theae TaxID=1198502 RepID=A0AAD5BIM9_9ASCO|nr:uncharacterized protein KGF57_000857 [Candida theae]KAI5965064.1 hypothetical protein KGF57_000857 [Candida theae]